MSIIGICGRAGSGKDTAADYLASHHGFVKVAFADEVKRIAMRVYDFTVEQLWGPSAKRNKPDKRWPRPDHAWRESMIPGEMTCACCGEWELQSVVERGSGPRRTCYLTPRYALQKLGTEWGRNNHPDTWTKIAMRTAKQLLQSAHSGLPWYAYDPAVGVVNFFTRPSGYPEHPKGIVVPDVRFRNEVELLQREEYPVIFISRGGAGLAGAQGQHQSETELEGLYGFCSHSIENDGTKVELYGKLDEIANDVLR